jgi:aromatic ring-opening dioxygenase catalytic subunit (LigB family)
MILLIPVAFIVAGLVVHMVLPVYRRHRMAAELRQDWWPRFERDLREYMSQRWKSAREAEQHL